MSIVAQYGTTTPAFWLTTAPTTGNAFPATDPSNLGNRPQAVLLQAETENVRFTTDGSAPTSSYGMILVADADATYYAGPLNQLRFIQAASGAVLNVTYLTTAFEAAGPTGASGAQGAVGPTGGSVTLEALAALGVPVVMGPYTLDYTDIPADTNRKTLFTPDVGDVILTWWTDPNTYLAADGDAVMGQGTGWVVVDRGSTNQGPLGQALHGGSASTEWAPDLTLMAQDGGYRNKCNADGSRQVFTTAWSVTTAGPVQVENASGGTLTRGHADYYFLVKQAAP